MVRPHEKKRYVRGLVAGILSFGYVLFATLGYAAQAELAWNPNSEGDLQGYGVYYQKGSDGPPYELFGYVTTAEMDDPQAPSVAVTGLEQDATYYFAVTAFDASGNESAYSSSVCAQVGTVVVPCAAEDGSGSDSPASAAAAGSDSGGGGGGCFIQSATVPTGTADAGIAASVLAFVCGLWGGSPTPLHSVEHAAHPDH